MDSTFTRDRCEEIIHLVETGRTTQNAQDADRAIRLLRETAMSETMALSTEVANTLALLGLLDDSRNVLAAVLRRDPADNRALAILATVESASGRYKEALACFDRVLALAPDFPNLAEKRARCQAQQGVLERATRDLETYAETHRPDAPAGENELIAVDGRSLDGNGRPRFRMYLPKERIRHDLGVAALFSLETSSIGYEIGLRRFLDAHLQSDDVFIDVGAHWGIHALTAATCRRGEIFVIAVEPHPSNLAHLRGCIAYNGLDQDIEVVPAAVGAHTGTVFLMANSSMGYRIGLCGTEVPITTLDTLLAEREWLRWRRLVLKIDVEGHESAVIEGAREMLDTCDVAAVIWELGETYRGEVGNPRLRKIFQALDARGFQHFRFSSEHLGGELTPLGEMSSMCNVYSLRPGIAIKPRY